MINNVTNSYFENTIPRFFAIPHKIKGNFLLKIVNNNIELLYKQEYNLFCDGIVQISIQFIKRESSCLNLKGKSQNEHF